VCFTLADFSIQGRGGGQPNYGESLSLPIFTDFIYYDSKIGFYSFTNLKAIKMDFTVIHLSILQW